MKPTVAHWISVRDGLPADQLDVLVCAFHDGHASILTGELIDGNWCCTCGCEDSEILHVTHWAPLPEGPK